MDLLERHRRRLNRQLNTLVARLGDVDRFASEGIQMPDVQIGARPVQIKIAVNDAAKAVEFYRSAFGFRYGITRRTDDEDYSSFMFGEYGTRDFFLMRLSELGRSARAEHVWADRRRSG